MELAEIMELLESIKFVVDIIDENTNGDTEIIPQDVIEVLESFGDDEHGNNDIEVLLSDIKNSLMYDEESTAIYELSSRLEVIDTRLDTEFTVINNCFGLIIASFITIISWKFFSWIMRLVSV